MDDIQDRDLKRQMELQAFKAQRERDVGETID